MYLFRNKPSFYGEEFLAPRPTPKLEYHPLSAVRDCLFNIFTNTPKLEAVLSSATRGPEGKRTLERPRRRWKYNMKLDLLKVRCEHGWIDLTQERDRWGAIVNAAMNFWVP